MPVNRRPFLLLLAALALAGGGPARADGARAVIADALAVACTGAPDDPVPLLGRFPKSRLLEARITDFRGRPGRARHVLLLADGGELRVSRIFPLGRLRRVSIEVHAAVDAETARPVLAAAADATCNVIEGRRLHYDLDGRAARLAILGPDMTTELAGEPLNPPIPAGRDPGGVAVAVVDTGVNYLLEAVAGRLARDAAGRALGHDFWDGDDRPFDLDTGRSPFFPLHHGTAVASIVLREAPVARIIPYRFPRPDMARMGELVAHADEKGARIVNLAMGFNKRDDWRTFEAAARARPHMLFVVSAGNDGRDIDARPVYPAALDLPNIVTVTSADAFGRLAAGSNWGRKHVDIMAPGEKVPVIDHRGVANQASGSSFAVPRIAALAARWLAKHPDWTAPELKRALISRARPSPRQPDAPLRHGWIPDPTDDFLP